MAPSFFTLASSLLLLSTCYARSLPNLLERASPAVPATLPGTWTSKGCYTDGNPRTLADKTYMDTTGMTVESCISFCDGAGFVYAGVEYAQECCKLFYLWSLCSDCELITAFRLFQLHRLVGNNNGPGGLQYGLQGRFRRIMRWSQPP